MPVSFLPRRCLCVATPRGLVAPRRAKNRQLSHQLPVCPAPVPLRGRLSICLGRCVANFPSSDGGAASGVERNPCFHLISLFSSPSYVFFVIRLTSLSISSPVDSLNPKTWQAGINRKVNPTPSLPSSPLEPHRKRRNRQPVSVPSLWIFLSSYIAIGAAPSQFNGMTLEDIKTLMGAMKEPADMVLLLPSPTFPKCFIRPPPPEAVTCHHHHHHHRRSRHHPYPLPPPLRPPIFQAP